MTLAVGLARDGRGTAALHLATLLARSRGEDLVVCTVLPEPWPAGMARIDAEYQAYLDSAAKQAVEQARATLPADVTATFEVLRARSTPTGLLDAAARHEASMLVLGSSAAGPIGQVSLGSVADRVLHSAHLPVAMAPRGFRTRPDATVHRITAAYGATSGADELVLQVAEVAARHGTALRVASFAVLPHTPLTAGVGSRAETGVFVEWRRRIEQAQAAALARVAALAEPPPVREATIGQGRDWRDAIDEIGWTTGDLLVVGSSSIGPLARVFLGSRASKIVRNSPIPVVVLPRH